MFKRLFCSHEWKVLDKVQTKSELDLMVSLPNITSLKNASNSRCVIQVICCDKCGKLKRFVSYID